MAQNGAYEYGLVTEHCRKRNELVMGDLVWCRSCERVPRDQKQADGILGGEESWFALVPQSTNDKFIVGN